MELFSKNSNLCDHNSPTSQRDRRTDRQTTCDRNTALCTKVHRAVKSVSYFWDTVYILVYEKIRFFELRSDDVFPDSAPYPDAITCILFTFLLTYLHSDPAALCSRTSRSDFAGFLLP